MSKIKTFLRAFYTVCYIDDAKLWLYVYSVALYKEDDDTKTGLVAQEARALHARSHGSGKSEWFTRQWPNS